MNSKYRVNYIPAPVQREPGALAIYLGAALFAAALYIVTFVLFSL